MTGLNEDQIAAFRAYGYVVIRGALTALEHSELSGVCERLLAKADPFKGKSATRLQMFPEDVEPGLAAVVAHPRLMDAMRSIWGQPCLYLGSFLWANSEDTPWHTTGAPGEPVQTVRVTVNLDKTSADQGALHVIPGTHFLQWNRGLYDTFGSREANGYRLRLDGRNALGAVPVATQPGDVILWWNRLWHGAWARCDGRPRRALFLTYVPDPIDDADLIARLRDDVWGILTPERPSLYAPSVLSQPSPDVAWMVERLESLTARSDQPTAIRSGEQVFQTKPMGRARCNDARSEC